jgi:hypothetical protein
MRVCHSVVRLRVFVSACVRARVCFCDVYAPCLLQTLIAAGCRKLAVPPPPSILPTISSVLLRAHPHTDTRM